MADSPRILVVDDEERSVELLVRTLRGLGSVETALSGEHAWELAQQGPLGLVVADQRMPGMSGVDLFARITDLDEHTGRILLTGYADIAATIDAINRGRIHAYLAKPCSPEELQATARALLKRVHLEHEKDRLLVELRAKNREVEVLAVAPSASERRLLAAALETLARVRCVEPSGLAKQAPLANAAAAVAILDGTDPRALEALLPLRELPAGRAVILIVRDPLEELIEEAIRSLGPQQVLTEPVPVAALRLAVGRVLPVVDPRKLPAVGQRRKAALLGVSEGIRGVLDQIRLVAPSRIPILILGETGTGKELVARAIHESSPRASGPFVAVNCGALPETLLESELFGHARGAFTGADRDKKGLFEVAHGGTLFLDEVGDMSSALQARLLRVIEEGEVRRVGSTTVIYVDVRIVSATHRDLEGRVERETFRQDLLYRLNTMTIRVPPLRNRRVDIPFLAKHFAEELAASSPARVVLGEDFLDALERHDYPGNVRELRNRVERAIALAQPGETLGARHLAGVAGKTMPMWLPASGTLRDRVERVEIEAIRDALVRFDGNRTRVAEALGLSRTGLREKMRRLGLAGDAWR